MVSKKSLKIWRAVSSLSVFDGERGGEQRFASSSVNMSERVSCAGYHIKEAMKNRRGRLFMPWGDGTGPAGCGPRTGRRRGVCRGWRIAEIIGPRRIGGVGSLLPFAAALIRDLSNHNGVLRSLGRKFLMRKTNRSGARIDARYSIVEEKRIGNKRDLQH